MDAVEAAQMPIGLVPKVFNPVDVMAAFADKHLAVVDAPVVKLRNIQHIVHLNTFCMDEAVRPDPFTDNRGQRRTLSVWDDGRVHLAAAR